MAETPSPATAPVSDADTLQYWCHHCLKRVAVETLVADVVCQECKKGFVESITSTATLPSDTSSLTSDQTEDSTFGSQFLQMLRVMAESTRDEDAPRRTPQDPQSDDDFLRIELDGWDNDEEGGESEEEESRNEDRDSQTGQNRSDNEIEEDEEEDTRRSRRDVLSLRIRDIATRARSGRNRILDWAEILMGLDDSSIEFRLQESDRYIGHREDYMDAAGYESLLQSLAENESGRRGAPPAAKSAIAALPMIKVSSERNAVVCAVCKDIVNVGEMETKLPCGHGYHGDCIIPWLGSRNSCPVCRFELPTDDAAYEEERKKKRAGASVSGASSSRGNNWGFN